MVLADVNALGAKVGKICRGLTVAVMATEVTKFAQLATEQVTVKPHRSHYMTTIGSPCFSSLDLAISTMPSFVKTKLKRPSCGTLKVWEAGHLLQSSFSSEGSSLWLGSFLLALSSAVLENRTIVGQCNGLPFLLSTSIFLVGTLRFLLLLLLHCVAKV